MPIYKVTVNTPEGHVSQRLVKAATPAQAVRHVARPMISAEVAGIEEALELRGAGVVVEEVEAQGE